jgi:hypothetical protein
MSKLLPKQVLGSASTKSMLEAVPVLRGAIADFVASRYADALAALETVKVMRYS